MPSRYAAAIMIAAMAIATPSGQEPGQTAADKQKPAAQGADGRTPGQAVNIKLDLTITDQTTPGEPLRKTVTLVVADRASGSIRSAGTVRGQGAVHINADVRPQILQSGSIHVALGLEYRPRLTGSDNPTESSTLSEQIGVVLQPGKALIVSQAPDPASDRKITVELTATLLRP